MKQLLTLFCLWPFLLSAQFIDDFSDGNITQNPVWQGNTEKFKINDDLVLQLNDVTEGEALLFTDNNYATNCEWRFWIKLSFSPSGNNNARVYLVADNENFTETGNAYYLQFGESGSDDAIELFRQDGGESFSVCRGEDGLLSSSFDLGIKVIRNEDGLWQIFADENGGENYKLQAEAIDNTHQSTSLFGIYCKYTSSNSSKFYFDNIFCGDIYVDTQAPQVLGLKVKNDSVLKISFDEVLDEASAENVFNYYVDNGIGNPASAMLDTGSETEVELVFSKKFMSGEMNTLSIENITDLSGNTMEKQEFSFMYYLAQPNDLIINEIMADPTPPVNLPEYEYLEIYNTLPFAVSLSDWVLRIGSSDKIFENVEINANAYLIIAKDDAMEDLSDYGNFYGFGSFSLTNSGQDLSLISPQGEMISHISYAGDWYNDEEKMEGGWSIELINPENICSGRENFTASRDVSGGTPGRENSVNSDVVFYPAPIKFEMLDAKKIQIVFNQMMDSVSTSQVSNYQLQGNINNPFGIFFSGFKPYRVILSFENEFETQKTYQLSLKKELQNCSGLQMLKDTTIVFGIPQECAAGDVVINEILFNPLGDGVDFIELYNNSFKVFDLSALKIASIRNSPPNPPDTGIYDISDEAELLMPGAYVCITPSPQIVLEQYFSSNPKGFVKTYPFPSLSNDEGEVLLMNARNIIIDSLHYYEDMHFPLLNYYDGVSLERISFMAPSYDADSWHSAAESVGFATPAYENSQFQNPDLQEEISIEPEIFSPDNDGYNDVVSINYSFARPGYVLNIDIYNSSGYPIRKLINNEYISSKGSVFWDGIGDDNSKAPVGIYIIYIKVFDLEGKAKSYKRTVVLGARL